MKGWQNLDKRLLWGALFGLLLSAVAHANTLTKVRTVESDGSTRLIFSLTHRPSYQIIPELDQQRLVIVFDDTIAKFDASKLQFTDSMIQDLNIHRVPQTEVSQQSLRIEVLLKTSHVAVNHEELAKPTGLMVNLHQMTPSSQLDETMPRQESTQPTVPPEPTPASPAPDPTNASLAVRFEPEPATIVTTSPHTTESAKTPEASVANSEILQASPVSPLLPTAVTVHGIQGSGSTAEALAILDLYFHRPDTFAANSSLLWSVAAAYMDLGLYEQGDALYRQIAEHADPAALRAAATVKRGKIALLQGEFGTAEQLLREFIRTPASGSLLAEAYEVLGDTLMAQEQFGEAAEMYAAALSYTPEVHKPPQTLYKLGQAERKAENWSQAAEAFRQAIDQLQASTVAHSHPSGGGLAANFKGDLLRQLGDSLYKVQRYTEAVAAYQAALEQAPTTWYTGWTLYHLGKSYEALGQYGDALRVYQELTRQTDASWFELGHQALSSLRWRDR